MYKVCNSCGEEKMLGDFRKDKSQKSGYQPRCKVCARAKINANYSKYKEKTLKRNHERSQLMRGRVTQYKAEHPCVVCGEDETVCLEFHHIDPSTKSFALSSVTTQSWNLITEEIAKCVVVCRNCHTKIHAGIITI